MVYRIIRSPRLMRKPFRHPLYFKRNWGACCACGFLLLFAENNPRFGQVVGREFHRNLVSRHDANEMLAHFAGDVSQDVALTGQIDAKHRTWQHLRYRALSDDLRFLWHAIKWQRARKLQPNGANRRLKNPHPNLLPMGEGTTLAVERVRSRAKQFFISPLRIQ